MADIEPIEPLPVAEPLPDDPPPPDRASELTDEAIAWLHSPQARIVALYLTPVLLPVVGAVAFWLQNKVGIDMDPAEATSFIVAVILGAAAVIFAWVKNHGEGAAKLGEAALELERLYQAGRDEMARQEAADELVHGPETTFYYGPAGELGPRPDTDPEEAGAQPDDPLAPS